MRADSLSAPSTALLPLHHCHPFPYCCVPKATSFELGKSDVSVFVFGEWVHCESWGAGASLSAPDGVAPLAFPCGKVRRWSWRLSAKLDLMLPPWAWPLRSCLHLRPGSYSTVRSRCTAALQVL